MACFDTSHMAIYEVAVGNNGGIVEAFADRFGNECFDLGCRNSANGSGIFGLALAGSHG